MMRLLLLTAAALATAVPAHAQKAVEAPGVAEPAAGEKHGAKRGDDFDMAQMMAVFDKIFPAQPDPPAARLALAQATSAGILPSGTYAAIFNDMMSGLVDRVLAINPSDFAGKPGAAKPASASSLRQQIAKEDPHFEERMTIMRRVVGEELVKISALLEPKLREGLARSIARRFDERQLSEINAFLATDSGRAFGAQAMRMWVDPDVMRSMMQSVPQMMTAMPAAMARVEAATAHLPKPKPRKQPNKKS